MTEIGDREETGSSIPDHPVLTCCGDAAPPGVYNHIVRRRLAKDILLELECVLSLRGGISEQQRLWGNNSI